MHPDVAGGCAEVHLPLARAEPGGRGGGLREFAMVSGEERPHLLLEGLLVHGKDSVRSPGKLNLEVESR